MTSVTQRTLTVKQPYGGYLPVREMDVQRFDDGCELSRQGIAEPTLLGTTVDSLFRLRLGGTPEEVFDLAIRVVAAHGVENPAVFHKCLKEVDWQTNKGVAAAFRLCDLFQYGFSFTMGPVRVNSRLYNKYDVANARVMLDRLQHWVMDKTVIRNGFVMPGGYSEIVNCGDGDLLTQDGLWDIKLLKRSPTSKNTLQLLMYWRMGLRSEEPADFDVSHLGIFNPKLNMEWSARTDQISDDVVEEVERFAIGYGDRDHVKELLVQDVIHWMMVERNRAVRSWARSKELQVPERGRLPKALLDAYDLEYPGLDEEVQALRDSLVFTEGENGFRYDREKVVWPSWYDPDRFFFFI